MGRKSIFWFRHLLDEHYFMKLYKGHWINASAGYSSSKNARKNTQANKFKRTEPPRAHNVRLVIWCLRAFTLSKYVCNIPQELGLSSHKSAENSAALNCLSFFLFLLTLYQELIPVAMSCLPCKLSQKVLN